MTLPQVRETTSARRRVAGPDAVEAAIEAGEPVRCVVVPDAADDDRCAAVVSRAGAAGIEVLRVAPRRFDRMRGSGTRAGILALVGPDPHADLATVMARGGVVWLLAGPVYPGNVGFAIRTAEVSGADGLYVDNDFDHAARREAVRASMRADRLMPIGWAPAQRVIDAAREAGKRVIAVEDIGSAPPWAHDLTGPQLLVVGAEADGVPAAVLDRADAVIRLPMAGFIQSYNLQAAVAALAMERFRQLDRTSGATRREETA